VAWTANANVSVGEFGIYIHKLGGGWYGGNLVPANGASASYTSSILVNAPVDTGYQVVVLYRPVAGSGGWIVFDGYSAGSFAVTL